jgi:eukaryotic-like serine/threonine-protein kinase
MSTQQFNPVGLGAGTIVNNRYDVIRKLGAGGMSAVYLVVDKQLNNDTVALKLFEPKLSDDNTLLERFRNEVLITRKLTHPNIVRTFDFGDINGRYYYMTMEYIRGVTLDKLIRSKVGGGLSFGECLKILIEVLRGIAYAHEMGVIHRDLKPANILISEKGEVKLTDFGLARTREIDKRFTQTGECVGTPYYMAPEQIQNKSTDHRVDIYSMGIIAYELVTGQVPFSDESWFELASKIIRDPLPDITRKQKKVPAWFKEFIVKATAKNKEDRFTNASEMQAILEECVTSEFDETMLNTPLNVPDKNTIALSPYRAELLYTAKNTRNMRWSFIRLAQFAPFVLAFSLIAFAGVAAFSYGGSGVGNIKEEVKESTSVIKDFTDSMFQLHRVIIDYQQNKKEVQDYVKENQQRLDFYGNQEQQNYEDDELQPFQPFSR